MVNVGVLNSYSYSYSYSYSRSNYTPRRHDAKEIEGESGRSYSPFSSSLSAVSAEFSDSAFSGDQSFRYD